MFALTYNSNYLNYPKISYKLGGNLYNLPKSAIRENATPKTQRLGEQFSKTTILLNIFGTTFCLKATIKPLNQKT